MKIFGKQKDWKFWRGSRLLELWKTITNLFTKLKSNRPSGFTSKGNEVLLKQCLLSHPLQHIHSSQQTEISYPKNLSAGDDQQHSVLVEMDAIYPESK